MKIKKLDLSKFTPRGSSDIDSSTATSSTDSALLFLAKSMIPMLPKKVWYMVLVVAYFLICGLILNVTVMITLTKYLLK